MIIQTKDLTGAALDWAVAKAQGWMPLNGGALNINGVNIPQLKISKWQYWKPSIDWSQSGPLIDKYSIAFTGHDADNWLAYFSPECESHYGIGPTHLVSACRAIVAAELGDSVDMPDELV